MTTRWPVSVASAVERIRVETMTGLSLIRGELSELAGSDTHGGFTLEEMRSLLERIEVILDGFQSTFPIEAPLREA